jgi:TRAP-type C4-dicarboxylate transport system substrate-binding protein
MSTLKLAPLWGAAVVSTRTWAQVPADLQPRFIEAAQKIADSLLPDLLKADSQAIGVMQKYGLKINAVTPAAQTAWVDVLQKTFAGLVGTFYDRESYDRATRSLGDYLATHPRN